MASSDSDAQKSKERSTGTERVKNSPNLDPLAAAKTVASKIRNKDEE